MGWFGARVGNIRRRSRTTNSSFGTPNLRLEAQTSLSSLLATRCGKRIRLGETALGDHTAGRLRSASRGSDLARVKGGLHKLQHIHQLISVGIERATVGGRWAGWDSNAQDRRAWRSSTSLYISSMEGWYPHCSKPHSWVQCQHFSYGL